ncbi:MAG: tRNA (N(6)-L-threonylcarbamoyladenosine(37)-C(2))-methylthiotransferase MtaB [Lachnospirales bacterium]
MKKIATHTLGCKVNKYDTEAMVKLFLEKGYEEVDLKDGADVLLINTCSVTNLSEKKSRQIIRSVKNKNKDAIVVAAGCYAQVAPSEVEKLAGVNIVIGTKNRNEVYNLVDNYSFTMGVVNTVSDIMEEKAFESLDVNEFKDMTRAYLKIQEGCNQYCSYCIIPFARGNIRSRKVCEVLEEVTRLVNFGVKEVVLAGIHIASYGKDLGDTNLLDIIKKVHDIEGLERIRFSSVEPNLMNEEFVKEISKLHKVCDYFHLSLQSGCDKTLVHMRRKYTTSEYKESINIIRKYYDNPSISTDVIVGFPMENEQDFLQSYEFCKEMNFSKIHVFPYSPKKGTKAYEMGDHLSNATKEERAKKLRDLSDEMGEKYIKAFINKTLEILVEECDGKISKGHSKNYIKVNFEGLETQNTFVNVNITDGCSNYAFGKYTI